MRRVADTALLLVCAVLLVATERGGRVRAETDHEPTVLVQLTNVKQGSLPRIITVYGTVGTTPAAQQAVMAPVGAIVDTIYVKQGEKVAADAPLVRLGPTPTTAASYTQAIAAVRAAHDDVQRTRALVDQHLATRQQLATAEKAAADAQASLAALKAEGADSPQTVRAPFQAIVTTVSTNPGAIVPQGTVLLDLVRASELILHAGVVPSQAMQIKPGDTAKVFPLGEKRSVAGQVLLRASTVNPQTGLVPVDVSLAADGLFAGEMAEARITIGESAGYLVPHKAILVDDTGAPYVVQAVSGRARLIQVQILVSNGAQDVIEGPLDPAAPLVLAGNYQLKNGMRLQPTSPRPANGA